MVKQALRSKNFSLLLLLLFAPPVLTYGLDFPHPAVSAIFISSIGLWLSEAVPLPVTGLLVPVLAALYGALPAAKSFHSFGNDIIFLFLGCFLIACSMEKYGLSRRFAYFILGHCLPGSSFFSLNCLLALVTAFISMWISNTSATAIMTAVTVGILSSFEHSIADASLRKTVATRLLLTAAFASSIGGLATPIGSPPNLIALSLLESRGIEIDFLSWLKIGIPLSVLMLVVLLVVLELCFPLPELEVPEIKRQCRTAYTALGKLRKGEKQIALIFLITVLLWVLPSVLSALIPQSEILKILSTRLSMSVVGLLGGLSAFFIPLKEENRLGANLAWSDTLSLEWGTLFIFGGGLTLGLLLEDSGAAKDLSSWLFRSANLNSLFLLGCVVICLSILLSEVASNTAAASILIPLALGAAQPLELNSDSTLRLVLATTFGASFGFMLPVSTPPNALVYGTGLVSAKDMRRAGLACDLLGAALLMLFLFVAEM